MTPDFAYIAILVLSTVTCSIGQDPCTSTYAYEEIIQNVPEDSQVGSTIGTVYILGDSSEVTLYKEPNEYFSFNLISREVTLLKELDVDKGIDTYHWNVLCFNNLDISLPEKERENVTIRVKIMAVDVNDNGPVFQFNLYEAFVPEDLKIGGIVYEDAIATDADLPGFGNNKVHYFLVSGEYSEYFRIENYEKPTITLNKSLDYETLKTLNISVLAKDRYYNASDVRSSTTLVSVNVKDVDDEIPTFGQSYYTADVDANPPPNTMVVISPSLSAQDMDTGIPSTIWYSILQGPDENFRINNETGNIVTRKAVEAGRWTICVQAHQSDNPKKYGTALLDINVKGENVKSPAFAQTIYVTSVSENIKVGGTIINVLAQDPDIGTVLTYSLEDSSDMFSIDNGGFITTLRPLDYESWRQYYVLVKATDGTYTASAHINITIIDENDNNPTIVPTDVISVERKQGTVITNIQARDADAGTMFTYSLSTYRSLFEIDTQGTLYVNALESDIEKDSYDITVVVSDNGDPPREASSVISVLFPRTAPIVAAASVGADMQLIAIGLGIIAGVLLVLLVILLVYIIRRRHIDRESLDKAKLKHVRDPKGLLFTPKRGSEDMPMDMDLAFGTENTESTDGATTVQDNPLLDVDVGDSYAYIQNGTDPSAERNAFVDEIEIQTAVYPMKNGYKYHPSNGSVFLHEGVTSFKDTSSCESMNSDAVNSHRILMPTHDGRNGISQLLGSKRDKQRNKDMNGIDPDRSVVPLEEKPEITVYF